MATAAPAATTEVPDNAKRYLWSQRGINKLRNQGMWKEYGEPKAGDEARVDHLQTLRDTGKLAAMVRERFFLDMEDSCFASWEPPCMACPSCDDLWGAVAHP